MRSAPASRAALLSAPQLDLAELLDRTLGAGVVAEGDLTISVAGVELVYLNLRALLASVATLEAAGVPFGSAGSAPSGAYAGTPRALPRRPSPERAAGGGEPALGAALLPAGAQAPHATGASADRGERLERGLAQLVLTVVELLRKLMERQALRRVDAGLLPDEQVERLGVALERLERQLDELKERFDFDDDDLTFRLGPLPGPGVEGEGT